MASFCLAISRTYGTGIWRKINISLWETKEDCDFFVCGELFFVAKMLMNLNTIIWVMVGLLI